MLNNSQGSQGNNDLQTAQNAIAILIDQISKARGVGRTIVIDKTGSTTSSVLCRTVCLPPCIRHRRS